MNLCCLRTSHCNEDADPLSHHRIIFTVGHSTLPIDRFIAVLKSFEVVQLIDVRTIPRSRHNPQFNEDGLGVSLASVGISYQHMKSLGGLRHSRKDSPNTGWRNTSFRGYADYMQTPEFAEALNELIALSSSARSCIMCAEAVPWRCHRSLVGDALLVRGIPVRDIMSAGHAQEHKLTRFARVDGRQLTYPPEQTGLTGGENGGEAVTEAD